MNLGPVYTMVEKASGRSRMLGQDMVISCKWWMCRRRIKGNKIFLLSWASLEDEFLARPLEAGQETPPPEKPNSKKCRHVSGHVRTSPP
jgi:hypothetical protein